MFSRSLKFSAVLVGMTVLGASAESLAAEVTRAPDSTLKGDYEVVRIRYCKVNSVGFNANLSNAGDSHTDADVIRSTFTFNGDGTGTQTNASLSIRNDRNAPGAFGVRQGTATCEFTYEVFSDGSFTRVGECESEKVAGYGSSGSSVTGVLTSGQLANGNQSFVLADVTPNIETVTSADDGTKSFRICTRSGFGVKK